MKYVLTVLLNLASTFARGFVLAHYWKWFIMITFPSAPVLSLMAAIGLSLFWSFLNLPLYLSLAKESEDGEEWLNKSFKDAVVSSLASLLCLGVGWLWHLFM